MIEAAIATDEPSARVVGVVSADIQTGSRRAGEWIEYG